MPQIVFRQNPVLDALTAIATGRAEALKRKKELEAGAQYQADQRRADAIGGALGNVAAGPLQGYAQYAGDQYQDNRAIQQAMTRLRTLSPVQTEMEAQRLKTLAPIQTDIDVERFERFEPLYDRQLERRLGMQSAASVDMTPAQLERVGQQFYEGLDEGGRADLAPQLGLSPGAKPTATEFRTLGLEAVRAKRNNDARLAMIQDQQVLQQAQQDAQTFTMATSGNIEGVPPTVISGIQADYQKLLQQRNDGSMTPRQSDAALQQFQKRVVGLVQPYTAATGGPRSKKTPIQQLSESQIPGTNSFLVGDKILHAQPAETASFDKLTPQQQAAEMPRYEAAVRAVNPNAALVPPGSAIFAAGGAYKVEWNPKSGHWDTVEISKQTTKEPDSLSEHKKDFFESARITKTSGDTGGVNVDQARDLANAAGEYAASKSPEYQKAAEKKRVEARAVELKGLLTTLLEKKRSGAILTPEEVQRAGAITRELEAMDRAGG